ncbi:L,D-transpeptidase [Rhodococcus aerolatus]
MRVGGAGRRGSWRVRAVGAVVVALGAVTTGCTIGTPAGVQAGSSPVADAGAAAPTTTTPAPVAPTLTVSAADGATGVSPVAPLTVTAAGGSLGAVTLARADGTTVAGTSAPDGSTWTASEPLGYGTTYTVTAAATSPTGTPTTRTSRFTTLSPKLLTMPYLNPNNGETVGIGQTVAVKFDESIADKAAAEKAITVTTTPPVAGAFYWLNDTEVRWRPETYWAPGTTVSVAAKVYGQDLGGGTYGQADQSASFTIGDAVTAVADNDTKTLTISRGGVVEKTMPISMGEEVPGKVTNNGVYIVAERYTDIVMDSSTFGLAVDSADGYRTHVQYATRMSYSGIFVHSAPWSISDQGVRNVSHGCLNVSPANAVWFYENTKKGDIVTVNGTSGDTLPGDDGLGDWNIPWSQWVQGNR